MTPRCKSTYELPPAKALDEVLTAHPILRQLGWDRKAWDSPVDRQQFECACAFLEATARPLKALNPRSGSYWLKHLAEVWAGEYVSNGALIAAALALGFRFRIGMEDSPNCIFNLEVDRTPRSIAATLSEANLDRGVLRSIAHSVASELAVPYWRFWTSFKAASCDCPEDAVKLALRLDAELKQQPGTTLAAFERVVQAEAAR